MEHLKGSLNHSDVFTEKSMIEKMKIIKEQYESLHHEGLKITAFTNQAIMGYDFPYLDGLLERALVDDVLQGETFFFENTTYYDIPVPIKKLWVSDKGYPLNCCSMFWPGIMPVMDTVFVHKRTAFEFTKKPPKTGIGRWMDRRIPYQSLLSPSWTAYCHGNKAEIARLLQYIRFLGKHRGIGYGEIDRFEINEWDGSEMDCIMQEGKLLRAVPKDCGLVNPKAACSTVGWTPPYWKPNLFSNGWRAGEVIC